MELAKKKNLDLSTTPIGEIAQNLEKIHKLQRKLWELHFSQQYAYRKYVWNTIQR